MRQKGMTSDFYCTQCGNKSIPIYRQIGRYREDGHLKKLFCLTCQKEVNAVEVKSSKSSYTKADFDKEFLGGNFNEKGERIKTIKQFFSNNK